MTVDVKEIHSKLKWLGSQPADARVIIPESYIIAICGYNPEKRESLKSEVDRWLEWAVKEFNVRYCINPNDREYLFAKQK